MRLQKEVVERIFKDLDATNAYCNPLKQIVGDRGWTIECPACCGVFGEKYWEPWAWLRHPNTGCVYSCHVTTARQWQKWCDERIWLSGYSPLEYEGIKPIEKKCHECGNTSGYLPMKYAQIMSPIFPIEDVKVYPYWDPIALWGELLRARAEY